MILPSLLGLFQGMMADSSPTARFDEHRHPKNTIGLVCALGEQGRRTAAIPTLCGRWASTRDQRAALSPLVRVRRARRSTSPYAPFIFFVFRKLASCEADRGQTNDTLFASV